MGMGSGKGKAPKSVAKEKATVKAKDKAVGKAALAAATQQKRAAMAAAKPKKPAGKGINDPRIKMAERKSAAPKEDESIRKLKAMAADAPRQAREVKQKGVKQIDLTKPMDPAKEARLRKESDEFDKMHSKITAAPGMKKGGMCKKYARGGGIEVRGKTKGKII
jgi:hypothetical protein